jgi:hypothetical protein
VVVTASFRVLYMFVVLEVGTRRILHWNVTDHPTAHWTAQQFRRSCLAIRRTDLWSMIETRSTRNVSTERLRRWVWWSSERRFARHKRTPFANA